MKEYIKDGVRVKEYSFEDWQKGIITTWHESMHHVYDEETGKLLWIEYLPEDQYDLVWEAAKKLYWERVEEYFKSQVTQFEKSLERSGEKRRLLQQEIEKCENLLFGREYANDKVRRIRELYDTLIVRGEKDYSKTHHNYQEDDLHIHVEASKKYLDWLKSLDVTDYNFEDWLEGKLDGYYIFIEGETIRAFEDVKSIHEYPKYVYVKKEDYGKIVEAKEFTYNFYLDNFQKRYKTSFIKDYLQSPLPEDFINDEIEEYQERANESKEISKEIRRGKLKSYNITSQQYKQAKEVQGYFTLFINDYHTIHGDLLYGDWLKSFKDSNEKERRRLIIEVYNSLTESQKNQFNPNTSKFPDLLEQTMSPDDSQEETEFINSQIEKYTFEDWLKNKSAGYTIRLKNAVSRVDGIPLDGDSYLRINEKPPKMPVDSRQYNALILSGQMDRAESKKIQEAQKFTYDFFLKHAVLTVKVILINQYLQSISKDDFIEDQINIFEKVLSNFDEIRGTVNAGTIHYFDVTAESYQKACEVKDFSRTRKSFEFTTVNDYHDVDFRLILREWLLKFKASDENQKRRLMIEVYESLNEIQKIVVSKDKMTFHEWIKDVEQTQRKPSPQPITEKHFSAMEWATIFYYADETKLLSGNHIKKKRMEQFMTKHDVNTTLNNFKAKYHKASNRINKKNDYPINKLKSIMPFLKKNYKHVVTKVENDILYLKEKTPDY